MEVAFSKSFILAGIPDHHAYMHRNICHIWYHLTPGILIFFTLNNNNLILRIRFSYKINIFVPLICMLGNNSVEKVQGPTFLK